MKNVTNNNYSKFYFYQQQYRLQSKLGVGFYELKKYNKMLM